MKHLFFCLILLSLYPDLSAQQVPGRSGNPLFKGWYADPEATIINQEYWIFPTYSDKYKNQVFFDAFSSKDLVNWQKHARILDTAAIKWANMAMWAPAIVEKDKQYFLFFGVYQFS